MTALVVVVMMVVMAATAAATTEAVVVVVVGELGQGRLTLTGGRRLMVGVGPSPTPAISDAPRVEQ